MMTNLDRLIAELCPDGVEYVPLGDIYEFQYGKGNTIPKTGGAYPVYGSNGIVGTHNEYNSEDAPVIGHIGAYAGIVNWGYGKHFVTYNGVICKNKNDKANYKYAYYLLLTQDFGSKSKNSSQPYVSYDVLQSPFVPLPPLPIQHEIVRILDNFTELTVELIGQLTAELKIRKKQYEYYHQCMVSNSHFEVAKLEDIADIYLGLTYTPTYVENGIRFISAQNTSKDYLDLTDTKFISVDEYNKSTSNAKPKRGDILFTRVGSNLGHPVIVDTDEELCIFVSLGFLRIKNSDVLNTYIKHWINSDMFWEQVRKNVHGAAKVNLNTGWLKKFDIPLPTMQEQNRIISVLDRLDSLTVEISDRLSDEISARKKQYEYYRDKLLTFNEAKT